MTGATAFRDSALRDRAGGWLPAVALIAMALAVALTSGCTKREKVVDVETPAGSVEVYEEKPVTE